MLRSVQDRLTMKSDDIGRPVQRQHRPHMHLGQPRHGIEQIRIIGGQSIGPVQDPPQIRP